MLFLLDTNACSDLMAGDPRVQARMNGVVPPDGVATCAIARGEILHGIRSLQPGQRQTDLDQKARRLFATIACHAVPCAAADHYAELKVACRRGGIALHENDLWIAATALAMGATLVTRDNDFKRLTVLPVEDWSV